MGGGNECIGTTIGNGIFSVSNQDNAGPPFSTAQWVLMHGVSGRGDSNGSHPTWQTHSQRIIGLRFPRSITHNKLWRHLSASRIHDPFRYIVWWAFLKASGACNSQTAISSRCDLFWLYGSACRPPLLPSSCWSWLQLVVSKNLSGLSQRLMSSQARQVNQMKWWLVQCASRGGTALALIGILNSKNGHGMANGN